LNSCHHPPTEKVRIQSEILTKHNSRQLLGELIRLGYSSGHNIEFVGVSKRHAAQDVSIPSRGARPNLTPNAYTTTLIVKGIPLQQSQIQVSAAIHRLLGARNVISVTYNRAQEDELGRHDGITTVRCLNSLVYTHWVNRTDVPLLGKIVEILPHRRSIAGSALTAVARQHDSRPTKEALADTISAMQNNTTQAPSIEDMREAMRGVEQRIEARLNDLGMGINTHTTQAATNLGSGITSHVTQQIEASTAIHTSQQNYLIEKLRFLADASEEYNRKMAGLQQELSSTLITGPYEAGASCPPSTLANKIAP
jgi:hypothetical protein